MSFDLDIKCGQELNSNLYILQTTSSSLTYVLISRNLIGYVRPKRDSEMLLPVHSDTKDGHALNSLCGIFQTISSNIYIYSLEQKFEWRNYATWRLRINKISNQISKIAKIYTAIVIFFKQHLPPNHMSS